MAEERYRWAEPGLEEVAAGVFRCPLPLPGDALRAVNAYLVEATGGFLLIDCGWDRQESREGLLAALRRLGASTASIVGIFATHVHRDHLGLASWVRDESGAWLTLGIGDRDTQVAFARDPASARESSLERLRRCSAEDVVARLVELGRSTDDSPWLPTRPDFYLVGHELLSLGDFELGVVATPGHTRGHLCLFDETRSLLFAGDHVLPHITPTRGVVLPLHNSPLASFMDSLERVRDLPAELVLPAHGPVFGGLAGRVDELLDHHRDRLESCLQAVGAYGRSAREVAGAMPWTRRRTRFSDLDPFNQMLAVFESEAHLRVLVDQGRLETEVDGGRTMYLPERSGIDPHPALASEEDWRG
ncbi:MAG: MBL fold metallo-hydrolase [Candidatus Dormibacteria bacterium]